MEKNWEKNRKLWCNFQKQWKSAFPVASDSENEDDIGQSFKLESFENMNCSNCSKKKLLPAVHGTSHYIK